MFTLTLFIEVAMLQQHALLPTPVAMEIDMMTSSQTKWVILITPNDIYLMSKHLTHRSPKTSAFLLALNIISVEIQRFTFSLLKGFQALISIFCWLQLLSWCLHDYAMIQNWPGSYSACSSDHAIKTWIYIDFNKLNTLSITKS